MGKALRKKTQEDSQAKSIVKEELLEVRETSFKWSLSFNPLIHLIFIILFGLIAYSNTFNVPFQFDDGMYIIENPVIKDLQYFKKPSAVEEISASNILLQRTFKSRFIGYLTFALNYKLHGLNVTGYHIFNIAIHILNAILVYWFVVLTFKTPYFVVRSKKADSSLLIAHSDSEQSTTNYDLRATNYIALFSALIFVSHPIQTQAVTYISQRVTSLATFFYLLSFVMYIKARLKVEVKAKIFSTLTSIFYLFSILSAVLAMKTKEIAFTLPILIALYEFMFFEGKIKRRTMYLIPLLLTMLIIPLSRMGIDKPLGELISDVGESTKELTTMSRWDYLFTQFRVIVTYIRLLFFPVNQNLDYDYPIYTSFSNPNVFLSFLFLVSIFGLGVYLFYRSRLMIRPTPYTLYATRLIAFGIFWFFITLMPESSLIPIADVIFEHRVYLPSIGIFIAINIVIFIFVEKLKPKWKGSEKIVIGVLIAIIILLTGVAYARNTVWQNEITLWEDVVKKSPEKARGYNNLGYWGYYKHGFISEAIETYKIALKISPDLVTAHINLGLAYYKKGQVDNAIASYRKALNLSPDDASVFNNLGLAYAKQNNIEQAIYSYKNAIKIDPYYMDAHFNLGLVYIAKGLTENAREEFGIVMIINPSHQQAAQFLDYVSMH